MRRKDAVVVLSEQDYERLTGSRVSFKEFLLNGPDIKGLNLDRDKSPMRDVSL